MYDIWKKEAINELEMYNAKLQALTNIPSQIEELKERMTGIRSPGAEVISIKGGGGSRDDAYLNNIVAREKLEANLKAARRSVTRVNAALSVLTEEEKELLERFYMKPERGAAFNIAADKKIDHKTVYNRKETALQKFAVAMYGKS